MKRKIIAIILLFSFSMSFAKDIANTKLLKEKIKTKTDVILLANGEHLKGEIVKMTKNAFVLKNENGKRIRVKNDDVLLVGFAQELPAQKRYRLGLLDGKRAGNKRAFTHGVLGFLTSVIAGGIVTVGVVYLTSKRVPTEKDVLPENVKLLDDYYYNEGFRIGARNKAAAHAGIGVGTALVTIIALYLYYKSNEPNVY